MMTRSLVTMAAYSKSFIVQRSEPRKALERRKFAACPDTINRSYQILAEHTDLLPPAVHPEDRSRSFFVAA
jgi:hypothetical protein